MVESMTAHTLLDTDEKQKQMANLIILKLAVLELEKQNWYSAPYGGTNFVEDILFQTKLATHCVWEDFFLKRGINFNDNVKNIQKLILEINELNPEFKLKQFAKE